MMINPATLDASAPRSAAGRELMEQGYTILRGAASPSLIGSVAEDLGPRYAATPFCEGGFYGERTKRFGRLLIRSPHMADLVLNSAILNLAELALGNWCERIQLNLAQAIELHPGALAQFPHRDQDMWQGALGDVEYLVNIMWPLTPFNDERTAKRISDALGTATEQRAMKNYAGHRLSPWLGHLMVSRTETARALLTPGEVMQLPPDDEIVMASGLAPIRAQKARYYADARFARRILPPPKVDYSTYSRADDWTMRECPAGDSAPEQAPDGDGAEDAANGGIRQEPELPLHEDIAPPSQPVHGEFDFGDEDTQGDAARLRAAADRRMARNARTASLDPGDGIDL